MTVLLLSIVKGGGMLQAQTVLMPVSGSGDTSMSYAEVYDDGGPTAPYSSNCNATYTFHTVHPLGRYRIEIISSLTHPQGNALLQVKDGPTASGSTLFTSPSANNMVYYSNSNAVTLVFNADDDFPTDGFEVILCEFDNRIPENIQGHYSDSNTYVLSWNVVTPPMTWVVNYAIVNNVGGLDFFFSDSSNFQVIVTDTNTLVFPNIPVGYFLVYQIYSLDTSPTSICPRSFLGSASTYSEPSVCPCILPQNFHIVQLPNSIRMEWTTDTIATMWHIVVPSLNIDTLLAGSARQFTIPFDYPCNSELMYINGNCENNFCNMFYYYLPVGGCFLGGGSLQRQAGDGHSLTISWDQIDDPQVRYLLYYRQQGQPESSNVLLDTLPYNTTTYYVDGLQPHTGYVFVVKIICPDGRISCNQSTGNFSTTLDNCIDFIDLNDTDHIHRTWGTYSNPELYTFGEMGRHVAIVDTTLYDVHTGNQLRCIPPGEEASFRLGDDNIGSQGETIIYDYTVDSLDKDMIVLKYAVVMQNSNHTSVNQPHVTMSILDSTGSVIDTTCCYADFYAAGDLGWNSVPGTNIIWKDWTTIGIDIAPYHGQQIKIRFTTTDCADGGHFGYAYFNIRCDSKRIDLVNLCDSEDSVTLRAPLGFEYQWTRGSDTTVISTENEIKVPADLTPYYCHASFIGKPECFFSIHSLATLPEARAAMHYDVDTCGQRITLYSDCKVNIDEDFLPYVHQTIDSVSWEVQGDTLYGDTIVVDIHDNGLCYIRIRCKLSDSYCSDMYEDSVWFDIVHHKEIVGDTMACLGDTVILGINPPDTSWFLFVWDDSSQVPVRPLVVTSDTVVRLVSQFFSCVDTLYHTIGMFPHYDDTLYVDACPGITDTLDFHEIASGLFTHNTADRNGCDSLTSLLLTVHPAYYDTVRATLCGESFLNEEFSEDSSGVYTHAYTTVWGCDSLYHLDFVRYELWSDTLHEEILYGETYQRFGFEESEEGFYEIRYTDVHGCDSVQSLDLTVIWLRFPNVVTPNGDGYNDRFEIPDLLRAKIFDYNCLWIYDRWGRLIYKKENIHREEDFWDPNKTNTPDGTYFYRFFTRAHGQVIDHKSAIEVIR